MSGVTTTDSGSDYECHSNMISGSVCALIAGFLGAAASLSAKLSLGADYLREMCESGLKVWTQTHGGTSACDWLHIPLRLLCGGLLFACNAVMWTFFSKALRHCSSSARATVTTTASNFISSAVLGRVIFGESHAALWWAGISLTLCGLLVLHGSTPRTLPQEEGKKDE
ncbi:transmembrane protein 42-like [Anoplopoma fimbria]|uniref:transmembrane protein 42-like n=1 Tax=Anoplopoma fimbria TaxID=229290 RepID=UPI0023EB7833|nr:transmembrane protein 42-like [Anoplopoma fimbria]